MPIEDIEKAIVSVRTFLTKGVFEAFDGVQTFEPQVGWAPVVEAWRIVHTNNHLLDEAQRTIIDTAFSELQDDLNNMIGILRAAAASDEDANADTPTRHRTIRNLELALEKTSLRFGESARQFQDMLSTHETASVINQYGNTYMGDHFSNISNSVVLNKSMAKKVVNQFKERSDNDLASFIEELSVVVERSGDKEAGELLDQLNEELDRDEPRKSLLKRTWDGLVDVLPSVAKIAGATAALAKLFG
ncbi:hypothetical protein [Cognatishimia activa]|uniref:hypothetical protein n=1 Tax=Cognatishimia activa TaxID=1715691 RepID=UPI002231887A|nr:hypothetical protein [Cognatishimia activa]UZD91757.1 hypothetical protein M0D42_03835 [Cognatishimia activa]